MFPIIAVVVSVFTLLAPFTFSQSNGQAPTCQQISNQTVFKQCISAVLHVKGTNGAQVGADQISACYTQIGNNSAYQQCLCAKTSAILSWYACLLIV